MKSPPKFVRGACGACCAAMRIALQEIVEGSEACNVGQAVSTMEIVPLVAKNALVPPATGWSHPEAPISGAVGNVCHGLVDAIVDFESGEFEL